MERGGWERRPVLRGAMVDRADGGFRAVAVSAGFYITGILFQIDQCGVDMQFVHLQIK